MASGRNPGVSNRSLTVAALLIRILQQSRDRQGAVAGQASDTRHSTWRRLLGGPATRQTTEAPVKRYTVRNPLQVRSVMKAFKLGVWVVVAAGFLASIGPGTLAQQRAAMTPEMRAARDASEQELQSIAIVERKLMVPMSDGDRKS